MCFLLMNKLLAGSMQQEVRYQTVRTKIQAALSRNKLELICLGQTVLFSARA